MAHFAKLDENNKVIEVLVVANDVLDANDEEASGIEFLKQLLGYENWKQTSYSGSFRKQYAGIGFTYDSINDVFIGQQPYPSWTLNADFDWQAPKPKPEGDFWSWDENQGEWINGETL